jgi:toxin HigB-1
MYSVTSTSQFKRMFKKLERNLQQEAYEKIILLEDPEHHKQLRVHKLSGRLKGFYSFSVNYKIRVVFDIPNNDELVLFAIGDHDIYN